MHGLRLPGWDCFTNNECIHWWCTYTWTKYYLSWPRWQPNCSNWEAWHLVIYLGTCRDLDRILHQVAEAGATFSGKKFQICQPQVLILGQTVGVNGREPDTKWVNAIKEWPTPWSATEARQFIGLCGTVRIWIPNYSQIASSITSTWKKGVEFAWTEECQDAFDVLKDPITTAPALLSIDYTCERPIIISVDSSYMLRLARIETSTNSRNVEEVTGTWRSSSSIVGAGGFHSFSQQRQLLERVSRFYSRRAHSEVVRGLREIRMTRDDWVDSS